GGAPVPRGTINEPMLAHPSPGNGNGRIYFSNSSPTLPNVGTIRYVDSATNADVVFDQAGISSGVTQDVRCEGIAASDAQPNVVYFLDGRANTIRRIVQGAFAHDLSYGNQPFTFNRPAGARFDSDGNLYVSATTSIFKVLPSEAGVVQVATGFTAAAGIDLTEDTGLPLLLVADEATGLIWLVNGETGTKEVVGSGFSGPVGVAFSEDPVTGKLFYDVAEPTRILRLPDPVVKFEIPSTEKERRVLVSKQVASDTYWSPDQTEDRKIRVNAKVTDGGAPVVGKMVYFRIKDPKDPSKYLNGHNGDNLPASPAGSVTASAVSNAAGMVEAILEVDPQYVGNNYEIEASFDPPPNFKERGKSAMYTSWRRLYIEHDRMYKEGSYLTQTSGAGQPNPARVFVQSSAVFSVGDEVHILSGDSIDHSQGEFGQVAAVEPVPGCSCVDLQVPLALTYSEPQQGPFPSPYGFLARRLGGFFDSQPDPNKMKTAFDDGYTDWLILPGDAGFMPFLADAGPNSALHSAIVAARTFLFFKNYERSNGDPFRNYVQLVSAARLEPATPPAAMPTLGLADGNGGADNWTWVFDEEITTFAAQGNLQNVRDHVISHELGHQMNVNQGNPLGKGHDAEQDWHPPNEPPRACLMNEATTPTTTGKNRFHALPAAPSRDLLCIRTHVDDLNVDLCP
ncbi:MAG: hypothetical protein HC897_15520, partial [Thermoanaerobaculia bacterium]|nr:hypothetical protein [Thermoanaerobaculia bacterium]